ncbi:uncharacterized protein STEHIDRAFT_137279 [Stereum hirsutum FP-91666 SS1]|uniref:uncharacterized protein n=1 Tax=Stereum hirsutum (strain FP-91666) TaxID=721885 RepID=UPI0004409F85|nr:uncharacterized protein STEHIDRAFT_137279 [Stereum hirsutum FP-91666 SS1]EIM89474.1 hypothetical protein STEHIDRAFT_137279 [Stereum hirsutum FP-91666 SS1]
MKFFASTTTVTLLSLFLAAISFSHNGLVSAEALAPRASGSPSCTYSCPTLNLNGKAIDTVASSTTTSVSCLYKSANGVCTYSKTSGLLTNSASGAPASCPTVGTSSCTATRKRTPLDEIVAARSWKPRSARRSSSE